MLALANLEGEKVFADLSSADHEMVSGLTSSLLLMEKVLNDVLDFNVRAVLLTDD